MVRPKTDTANTPSVGPFPEFLSPYSYDAEGRVLKVDGGTTNTYVYNSRGMRAALSGSENLFDLQGNIVSAVAPGTTTLQYNRYSVGGRLLAANSNNTTNFYHQDWLGGIRALSSLSGSLTNSCTNLPFGDGSNNCGLWNFAGLMADTWDNLNTSATRSQHPASGRWLTPDPGGLAVMDVSNPQTWNRYAYVTNNPLSFVDPTGLFLQGPAKNDCEPDAMNCGGGFATGDSSSGGFDYQISDSSGQMSFPVSAAVFAGFMGTMGLGNAAWMLDLASRPTAIAVFNPDLAPLLGDRLGLVAALGSGQTALKFTVTWACLAYLAHPKDRKAHRDRQDPTGRRALRISSREATGPSSNVLQGRCSQGLRRALRT